MTTTTKICQDNFIYCKTWTQNLDVKTSKKPKERVKNLWPVWMFKKGDGVE